MLIASAISGLWLLVRCVLWALRETRPVVQPMVPVVVLSPASDSVCQGCAYVQAQWSADRIPTISCTYGGPLRQVAPSLVFCSTRETRVDERSARQIGFVLIEPTYDDADDCQQEAAEAG